MDPPTGHLRRGLALDGQVRVLVADVTAIAAKVRALHALGPRAAALAAEGTVATALLAAHIKGSERLTLQMQSSDPEAAFIGDIDGEGRIRARLTPSRLPAGWDGTIHGALMAIKSDGRRELYRGVTPIEGMRLDDALREHIRSSAQVAAHLSIETRVTPAGRIERATGTYVERMPGAAVRFEDLASSAERIAASMEILAEHPLSWHCTCGQERVEAMLAALGRDELRAIREEEGAAEVTCDFCRTTYRVPAERLLAIERQA